MIEYTRGRYLVRHFPLHEARCRRAIAERLDMMWSWDAAPIDARRAETPKSGSVHESGESRPKEVA